MRDARFAVRAAAAGDGGDHQHLIAVLEGILLVAEEADVFFVDIEVDEAAHLALLVAQMLSQGRKAGLDLRDQFGQIGGVRLGSRARSVGVLLKCIGQQNSNGH